MPTPGLEAFVIKAMDQAPNFLFALIGYYVMFKVIMHLLERNKALHDEVLDCYRDRVDDTDPLLKD